MVDAYAKIKSFKSCCVARSSASFVTFVVFLMKFMRMWYCLPTSKLNWLDKLPFTSALTLRGRSRLNSKMGPLGEVTLLTRLMLLMVTCDWSSKEAFHCSYLIVSRMSVSISRQVSVVLVRSCCVAFLENLYQPPVVFFLSSPLNWLK